MRFCAHLWFPELQYHKSSHTDNVKGLTINLQSLQGSKVDTVLASTNDKRTNLLRLAIIHR